LAALRKARRVLVWVLVTGDDGEYLRVTKAQIYKLIANNNGPFNARVRIQSGVPVIYFN
jgi:hypothetical protein